MPDKKDWKEYRKKLRRYIETLKDLEDELSDYIDDMDSEGQTNLDAPKPPENPPPPPNP
jgi:hypothetical protein